MGMNAQTKALPKACSDEAAAVEFLERQRWGNDPYCPRCESRRIRQLNQRGNGERSKRFLWYCKICERQFTVRIGTVLEDSRITLRHWCYAFWRACSSKKGVSALQIHRETGVSYKSALFLMHRIRFAMSEGPGLAKLNGIVEADETFIGGKARKLSGSRYTTKSRIVEKAPVFAAVERGGRVRARTLE